MKNAKLIKIIATAASLVLIVLALCVTAGAENEDLSVKINARNVAYGDVVKVLFAVDNTNAGGKEIEVLYYLEDPTVNPAAQAYVASVYNKGYTDKKDTETTEDDVTYPAFFTAGFPAKNIGDKVYARAHIVGTEIYSTVERYSVVEYLLERLYVDNATGDKKGLYEYLLGYGAYAQKVIFNTNDDPADDVDRFITDYVLVGIKDGTLDGKYSQGIYFAGDKLTPYREGAKGWNVTVYDLATGNSNTKAVANGTEITVAGFTMITETDEVVNGPYKPNLDDTIGRILWSEAATPAEYKAAGYIDYWMGSGAPLEVVDGAPYGVASKVLHFGTVAHGSNQDQLFIRNTAAYANSTCAVFETDILVNNSASAAYEVRFMNNNLASADRTAYQFNLLIDTSGNGTISGSGLTSITAPDVAGNWFRLRAEYHDVSDTQFKIMVYYNDTLVAGSGAIDKKKGADHASTVINQVLFAASTASVADMYIDNTKLSHAAPAYTPDMSDLANRETYEDGDALNLFSYNNWINNSNTALSNVDAAPYGVASKAALFAKSSARYEELGFEQKNIPTGTKAYKFESDMMIANPTSGALIKGELRGSAEGIKFSLTVSGSVITLNSGHGTSNPISVVAPVGEWFRLTIECFTDNSGNNVVKFSINGQQVGSTYVCAIAPSAIVKTRFFADSNIGADIYFDNTKVEFITE